MKNLFSYITIVLLTAASVFSLPSVKGAEVITAAVFDFEVPEDSEMKGADAAILLTTMLSSNDALALVERSELSKVLGEAELGMSGAVDSSTAAQVGKLTGAKVLVTGRLFQAGSTSFLATKIIGTDTGRVFSHMAQYADTGEIADAITTVAEKIQNTISEKSNVLMAPREDPGARLTRLRAVVKGKDLPIVYVNIPEWHISNPIPDPAAQTEIQRIFQELGFTLTEVESKADFRIVGEAFSELGGRRGNLVSCRARVEVKVKTKKSPDEVKVDREMTVAIDLAENVAAKSALQDAGAILAERLVAVSVD